MTSLLRRWAGRDTGGVATAEHLIHMVGSGQLTLMQVLKLIYMAHGWMLALCNRTMFEDEVEAWTYGPVVPSVYYEYAEFGRQKITAPGADRSDRLDGVQLDILEQTRLRYGHYTGIQLSQMTHQPGSPWHRAKELGLQVIPNDLIQAHYRELNDRLRRTASG